MTTKHPYLVVGKILTVCILLLLVFGVVHGQGDVKIKNTARQIQPGLYECIIYLDISKEVSRTIDDVTFTLPPGYPRRKQKGQKTRAGVGGFFSSYPITTTEEAVVNVKIDYKGTKDLFLSYKLRLFTAAMR